MPTKEKAKKPASKAKVAVQKQSTVKGPKRADKNLFTADGVSGLNQHAGFISEDFLPQLRTLRQRVKVYDEMSKNDSTIGAFLFLIKMLIRQVDWEVIPVTQGNAEDEACAEFIESAIKDLSQNFDDFIQEVLSMLVFGFAVFEKIYKIRRGENKKQGKSSMFTDGKIGWRKFACRSQDSIDRWEYADDEERNVLIGVWQRPPSGMLGGLLFIPIEKLMIYRTESFKDNPEGESVLRTSFKDYYFKKNIQSIEAIGIERDLAGLPVIYLPPSTLDNAQSKVLYQDIIRNVRRDEQEGVLLPAVYDDQSNQLVRFELLSSGGNRQFNTSEIISRYDKRIAMTVAADFMMLGQDKAGSFALSSDKTGLFAVAIGGWLESIAATFNCEIKNLLHLNDMKGECILAHGDIENQDFERAARSLQSLAATGAVFDAKQINAVLEMANIPPLDENEI